MLSNNNKWSLSIIVLNILWKTEWEVQKPVEVHLELRISDPKSGFLSLPQTAFGAEFALLSKPRENLINYIYK